jgi:hypothetical protein
MLSFPVNFALHTCPSTHLLSPYALTLLHSLTPVRSHRGCVPARSHLAPSLAEEPREKDTLAFSYVSSASLKLPPALLLKTTGYRSRRTRQAPAALSPAQSILTKNAFANSFRMNTCAKHWGAGTFTRHQSRDTNHTVPLVSHSFHSLLTLFPLSPVFATLTKTPGGGPLPRHLECTIVHFRLRGSPRNFFPYPASHTRIQKSATLSLTQGPRQIRKNRHD